MRQRRNMCQEAWVCRSFVNAVHLWLLRTRSPGCFQPRITAPDLEVEGVEVVVRVQVGLQPHVLRRAFRAPLQSGTGLRHKLHSSTALQARGSLLAPGRFPPISE